MTRSRRTPAQLYATAIHEAGHAVIARVLGFPSGNASIERRGKTGGYTVVARPEAAVDRWRRTGKRRGLRTAIRARIIIQMAGASAEEKCLGASGSTDYRDQMAAATLVLRLVGNDDPADQERLGPLINGERYQQRLRRATDWLVQRHRQRIESLACALVQQRIMTDQQIRAVIGIAEAGSGVPTEHVTSSMDAAGSEGSGA